MEEKKAQGPTAGAQEDLPKNFLEFQYLHTLDSDKRHALLMAPFGVSFPVYRTLAYLMERPDGAAPSKIADDLMILRQSMTNIVDSLEQQGLVERRADPRDRRRIIVSLLPSGLSLARSLVQIDYDYTKRICQHFTAEELAEFRRLTQKMQQAKDMELEKILEEYAANDLYNRPRSD